MSKLNYPYKSSFAINLTKIANEDIDKYISKASLDKLKPLMPTNLDLVENKDLIACVLNAAVAGRKNANGDGITNKSAIRIAKNFINKYVNIGHKRDLIKGCIVNAGFSKFGTDEIISEEDASKTNEPFNISLAFILWKTALNDKFINLLEASVDPTSSQFHSVSGSWEILFKDYDIAIGNKNINEATIATETEKLELEKYLQSNGGAGHKDGKPVYRIIKGETNDDFLIPAGIGLVEHPAAEVKGLEIVTASHDEHYITKCSCGKVIEQCRCDSPNKKETIIEMGCAECKEKQPEISQSTEASVTKNNENTNQIKPMDKITKIEDISEAVKQSNASTLIADFINDKMKEANEKYLAEQNVVSETKKSLSETQEELKKVQASLKELQDQAMAKAAAELHTQRMTYFDDTYELSNEERQAIASEIQGLDKDAFEKAKNKFDIFLKEKSKASIQAKKEADEAEAAKKKFVPFKKGEKSKDKEHGTECDDKDEEKKESKASDASKEGEIAIDKALEDGKEQGVKIPNAAEAQKSLEETYAAAFSVEECVEFSK